MTQEIRPGLLPVNPQNFFRRATSGDPVPARSPDRFRTLQENLSKSLPIRSYHNPKQENR